MLAGIRRLLPDPCLETVVTLVDELLALALVIAGEVGIMAAHAVGDESRVMHKADGSPVTDADRHIEHGMRSEFARHHPDDSIVGEELDAQAGTSARR